MRVLYLVRHGQYVDDDAKPNFGSLTALGRKQARRIAERLAGTPFSVVHHSDLPRAVETAQLMAKRFAREEQAGQAAPRPLRLKSSTLLREGIPSGPAHWGPLSAEQRAHRARTKQRMDQAFDKYFRPSTRQRLELVVAHGNLIRYLIRRCLGDAPERWWRMDVHQCSLSIVAILPPPRHGVLIRFNDTGHLPSHLQTLA
jgi:broad specificity phosphatase PhoE